MIESETNKILLRNLLILIRLYVLVYDYNKINEKYGIQYCVLCKYSKSKSTVVRLPSG